MKSNNALMFSFMLVELSLNVGVAFSQASTLKIGDTYAGGIVFYLDGNGGGLVTAPSDQARIQWYNDAYINTSAFATEIGSGKANTQSIIDKQGAGNYAATLCANLDLGGFRDWYLPSKDELDLIYKNLKITGLQTFKVNWYWSSSMDTSSSTDNTHYGFVWAQSFDDGKQAINLSSNKAWVRAIRAFQQ
jgi:hypothetical protein